MDIWNFIPNLVIFVLLLIHLLWVTRRIKDISTFINQFKNASEGFETFFKTYSKMQEDLEKHNKSLAERNDALSEKLSEIANLIGAVDPEEVPRKMKSILAEVSDVMQNVNELTKKQKAEMNKQKQYINQLEKELAGYHRTINIFAKRPPHPRSFAALKKRSMEKEFNSH